MNKSTAGERVDRLLRPIVRRDATGGPRREPSPPPPIAEMLVPVAFGVRSTIVTGSSPPFSPPLRTGVARPRSSPHQADQPVKASCHRPNSDRRDRFGRSSNVFTVPPAKKEAPCQRPDHE